MQGGLQQRATSTYSSPDREFPREGRLNVCEVGGQDRMSLAALHQRQEIDRRGSRHVGRVIFEEHVKYLTRDQYVESRTFPRSLQQLHGSTTLITPDERYHKLNVSI